MAFTARTPVTAIELGTEKICVLHGCRDESGNAEVLAFAQAPSGGAIRKGMIYDYRETEKILGEVLDRADRALPPGSSAAERKNVYVLLNGMTIASHRGDGSVVIADGAVQEQHVADAVEKAHTLALSQGIASFASYDSFFVLDHQNRVKNPVGQHARHLDAYVHILTTEQDQLDGIRHILTSLGFEYDYIPVFNGIASAFGVLRQEEREQGVLLIDFGQGVCNYVLVCADGVYLSGVLSVGVTHLANDLSVGLELPYEKCLDFLREGRMTKLREAEKSYWEYTASVTGKRRRIPLDSFERIIELRLREIYSVILAKVREKKLLPCMSSGVVLCGGGALMENAVSAAREVFEAPVRVGVPFDVTGVMAEFKDGMASYAAVLGLLKYALADDEQQDADSMSVVREALSRVGDAVFSRFKWVRKALVK